MLKHWLAQSAQAGYLTVGMLALLLGLIGIVTPLLPTTPFLILAAWASAKGSSRLHNWLVNHPRLRSPLAAWRNEGAIPSSAKRMALAMLFLSWLMLIGAALPLVGLVLLSGVLITIATFIATRPTPTHEQSTPADNILLYRDMPVYTELRAYSDPEAFHE